MTFQTDFDEGDQVMSEINMTPLVDVMLVLLIVFIITMPVLNQAVKLQLPQAKSQTNDTKPHHINISVDAEGALFWDKQPVTWDSFFARMKDSAQQTPQPEIHLRADAKVAYEHVAKILASAQQVGLGKVAFATAPLP